MTSVQLRPTPDAVVNPGTSSRDRSRSTLPLPPETPHLDHGFAFGVGVDTICLTVSVVLLVSLLLDDGGLLRASCALIFALIVPGWTLLRLFEARATLLTAVSACALSISSTMILGQVLVTRTAWRWYEAGIGASVVCLAWSVGRLVMRAPRLGQLVPTAAPRSPTAARSRTSCRITRSVFSTGVIRALPGCAGFTLAAVATTRIRDEGVGDLGMISALPLAWFAGALLLVGGLVRCLDSSGRWRSVLGAHVVALFILLHGLLHSWQSHPRFPVAWLHVGFTDHIGRTGTLLSFDARFSWAGFFSGGALIQRWGGLESLGVLVRFAPLVINLAAIPLLVLIARATGLTGPQAILGTTLFACTNWVGQDYFSPQGVNFLLYLAVIAIVLNLFPADPASGSSELIRRLLRPETVIIQTSQRFTTTPAYLACVFIAAAMSISHQLTPAILVSALLLLAATQRIAVRTLPFVVLVLFIAWISFGAEAYWIGHIDTLFGSMGAVDTAVDANVRERLTGPSIERQMVIRVRMAIAVVMWSLAVVSIVVFRRRSSTPIALGCLFLAPFPMIVVQPYGGEMLLRVMLFSLPAACLLAARLVLPDGPIGIRRRVVLATALFVAVPLFVVARFGNERFERVTDADAALAAQLYSIAPPDALVYVEEGQTLLYAERVGDIRFAELPDVTELAEVTDADSAVLVMLSESQGAYGELSEGKPPGWLTEIERDLVSTGRFEVVGRSGSGVLLRLVSVTSS